MIALIKHRYWFTASAFAFSWFICIFFGVIASLIFGQQESVWLSVLLISLLISVVMSSIALILSIKFEPALIKLYNKLGRWNDEVM